MNLQLIKSESFGEVQADIYSNGTEIFMTANQLGECLEYSNPRESINKLVSRNDYLRGEEFSSEVVLTSQAGERNTRVFTEDGIYEVTMLSGQPKAQLFRKWIRSILKGLRKGELKMIPNSIKQQEAEARLMNAKVRQANLIRKIADDMSTPKEYKQVLNSKAVEILTGQALLPLPPAERKTYTAEEIGHMVINPLKNAAISANKVGRIANELNLKVPELGKLVEDKKRYSDGQCQSWRYYEEVVPKIQSYLNH